MRVALLRSVLLTIALVKSVSVKFAFLKEVPPTVEREIAILRIKKYFLSSFIAL